MLLKRQLSHRVTDLLQLPSWSRANLLSDGLVVFCTMPRHFRGWWHRLSSGI